MSSIYKKIFSVVGMSVLVGVTMIGLPLDIAQGADVYDYNDWGMDYGYNDWGMDYGYNDWGTDYVDHSYEPFQDYSYEPFADYSYEPFEDYSYEPFQDYSYEPFEDYSYEPFQDYSYEPFEDYSYEPFQDYSYEPYYDYPYSEDHTYPPYEEHEYPYYPYPHDVPVPQPDAPETNSSASSQSGSVSNSDSDSNSDADANANAENNVHNTNTNTNMNPNTNNNTNTSTNTNTVTNTIHFPEINLSQQQQVSPQVQQQATQPPTCTIWAHPTKVEKGGSAALAWYSSGATAANLTYVGSVPVSGSQTVTDIWGRTEYTLTVTGEGGTSMCKTTVDVKEDHQPTASYTQPQQPHVTHEQPKAAPHVSLKQVPYTGFGDPLLNMLLWLGMTTWAGGAGYYLYAFKRRQYSWLNALVS